jgi:restriction system protein
MSVPDYQALMFPILRLAGDKQEHSLAEAIDRLGIEFKLTDGERRELLPSGRQSKFDNRVGWALTYLKKAGLLESTARGRFRITNRGVEVLSRSKPEDIRTKFLRQYPEFVQFQAASRPEIGGEEKEELEQTPEERLESSYQALRRELAGELLDRVRKCSPKFFEKLVVDLLVAMGYGGSRKDAGQAVGQTGDGGVDGIIKEDKLGLDVVYIQAKRWDATVGRPVVQAFAGSLEGMRAKKGVMITTSNFSKEAREYASVIEKRIVLIDGEELAQAMIDHGVGVNEVAVYAVRKLDLDYFGEEK